MHSHPARVVVALTAKMRKTDGTLETVEARAPKVFWSDRVTHEEENFGDEAGETIEVELKEAAAPAVEGPVAGASTAASSLKEPVPVEKEPHHAILFQNQYARVMYVRLLPGEASLFHRHSNDNVSVELGGDKSKSQVMGGEWSEPANVVYGRVGFHKAKGQPYTHRVASAGEKAFLVIDVEVFP
jgi:hypothetical protein